MEKERAVGLRCGRYDHEPHETGLAAHVTAQDAGQLDKSLLKGCTSRMEWALARSVKVTA